MNHKALRLFRRIVMTGSLHEAADGINLSVSAASRVLSQLEHSLGFQLFTRDQRKLALSDEGQQFYAQIEMTLVALEEIPGIAREIRSRHQAAFSIVTAAPLANGLVVPTLGRMRAQHIPLSCHVAITTRFEIESKVAARAASIGLISLPVEHQIINLNAVAFARAQTAVLMPVAHPLASKEIVEAQDLISEPIVSLAPSQRWRVRYERLMQDAAVSPPTPVIETGSTLVSIEMVRAGLGLTLIDAICAPPVMDGLALRPLAGEHWNTYATLHPKKQPVGVAEPFLQALHAHLDTLAARYDPARQMLVRS